MKDSKQKILEEENREQASYLGASLWCSAFEQLKGNKLAVCSAIIIAFYTILALYGEAVFWYYKIKDKTPPYQQTAIGKEYQPPTILKLSFEHPFGTDNLGRDVFQRTVQGTRIAFQVGIVTSLIAIPIGVLLGALGGYFGGKVDDFIVWLTSAFYAIPGLLFVLAIAMVVGKGLIGVYLSVGLTTWVGLCRLIRAEVMKHKNRPYVVAARALGYSHFRILFRHILPNVFHIVIISFSLRFPSAISTEVFLSFLGIGVQGEPSWGIMISNARLRLWQGVWWEMTFVTLAIFFIVLAFNILGDALRDALDPRLKTTEH